MDVHNFCSEKKLAPKKKQKTLMEIRGYSCMFYLLEFIRFDSVGPFIIVM
jgi:hypothetical protein